MSNVGWVGLGKLGLTCALTLAHTGGHRVFGYDVSDLPEDVLLGNVEPFQEEGLIELLGMEQTNQRVYCLASVDEVVLNLDTDGIVFVSAQTPHSPKFGGETPPPEWETRDFEYSFLINAVRSVATAAKRQRKNVTIVVISTVLPGTSNKHLFPLLNEYTSFVYNPFFIAMGTTMADFVNPEFVLLGSTSAKAQESVELLYKTVHTRPIRKMSVESAELTKVAYNTFISLKITFANTLMEICHKSGADVDEVTQALASADQRIASGAYMHGGMGDGGGCHPRDNIAMTHLANRLALHADPFSFVTDTRTTQSAWLAEELKGWYELTGLPVTVLGVAYKPESNLTLGSPALLLISQLDKLGVPVFFYDEYVDQLPEEFRRFRVDTAADFKGVFFVGTRHEDFTEFQGPHGSVVVDPFGFMPDTPGVTTIRLGRKG